MRRLKLGFFEKCLLGKRVKMFKGWEYFDDRGYKENKWL